MRGFIKKMCNILYFFCLGENLGLSHAQCFCNLVTSFTVKIFPLPLPLPPVISSFLRLIYCSLYIVILVHLMFVINFNGMSPSKCEIARIVNLLGAVISF